MSDRKNRFNFFKFKKNKNDSKLSEDIKESNELGFFNFDSIIPENSPLKKNSSSDSGFINDELTYKNKRNFGNELDDVDEKYSKYIFFNESDKANDFEKSGEYESYKNSRNPEYSSSNNEEGEINFLDEDSSDNNGDFFNADLSDNSDDLKGNIKHKLLNLKMELLNKDNHSKTLFGKITFVLIFLVLLSSIFYFFVYQPFQNELNLEKNSKLNEVNALYRGPLELNENAYSLKSQINQAYDIEEKIGRAHV